MSSLEVCIESTPKRAFAVALGWPGWARSGKTEEAAIAALVDYTDRYAVVMREAGLDPAVLTADVHVVERVPGDMTTEFGAPGALAAHDRLPLKTDGAAREAALVAAAWRVLASTVAGSPEALRKGPRGGGRDRGPMVDHVVAAEAAYARKLGVRAPKPLPDGADPAALVRVGLLDLLARPSDGTPPREGGWPPRYAARRIAWHVLDHAWEMADRSTA